MCLRILKKKRNNRLSNAEVKRPNTYVIFFLQISLNKFNCSCEFFVLVWLSELYQSLAAIAGLESTVIFMGLSTRRHRSLDHIPSSRRVCVFNVEDEMYNS